jgi:heme/copper-type cytochrome/quinol oxidase subunit 2
MSNLVYVFILLILLSIIIGISLQNLMVNDISELKWIQRFNLDNGIILFITILYNNFIFIFSLFSFILCGLNTICFLYSRMDSISNSIDCSNINIFRIKFIYKICMLISFYLYILFLTIYLDIYEVTSFLSTIDYGYILFIFFIYILFIWMLLIIISNIYIFYNIFIFNYHVIVFILSITSFTFIFYKKIITIVYNFTIIYTKVYIVIILILYYGIIFLSYIYNTPKSTLYVIYCNMLNNLDNACWYGINTISYIVNSIMLFGFIFYYSINFILYIIISILSDVVVLYQVNYNMVDFLFLIVINLIIILINIHVDLYWITNISFILPSVITSILSYIIIVFYLVFMRWYIASLIQSILINIKMSYGSKEIESIILFFDQSIILYTGIINAIILGIIIIIKNWYLRKGVCNNYIYNIKIEIIWTILPILFVIIIVLHSITVIYNLEINKGTNHHYINIVGNQWYWIYNNIESRISNLGRIILVDQPLYIKANTNVHLIVSSLDVIHSFALPSLGIKIDAIPGRISNVNINGLTHGLYVGYCSELCGSGHAFMPINLIVY